MFKATCLLVLCWHPTARFTQRKTITTSSAMLRELVCSRSRRHRHRCRLPNHLDRHQNYGEVALTGQRLPTRRITRETLSYQWGPYNIISSPVPPASQIPMYQWNELLLCRFGGQYRGRRPNSAEVSAPRCLRRHQHRDRRRKLLVANVWDGKFDLVNNSRAQLVTR